MKKSRIFLSVLFMILVIFILLSSNAGVDAIGSSDTIDVQQIKTVITRYFEARGQSFQNLKLNDFNPLIINKSSNSDMKKNWINWI